MNDSFRSLHSVHFVGIKGVAMTALAIYCKERGMSVSGSDVADDFPTKEALEEARITPLSGFSPSHISVDHKPDLVIYTGAHGGRDNPEVKAAEALAIQTLPHGRALGMMMDGSVQLSVAGSHGKTTTTAMIATILMTAGKDPSYAVGCGSIRGIGLPGHFGSGSAFIAEADEYVTDPTHDSTPRFLWQHPDVLTVTNIDFDHPDAYRSLREVQDAFIALQHQQQGLKITVVNADDPNSAALGQGSRVFRYGFDETADLRGSDIRFGQGKTLFRVTLKGNTIGEFILSVPGTCNVANALAAMAATHALDIPWEDIRNGLAAFKGSKRRFEFVGSMDGMDVYDDYAHHPHEIAASVEGIRAWYPDRRLITVFQPHTYSRTKSLLDQFARSFKASDMVLIPDIYASARETATGDISAEDLVRAIARNQPNVQYVKDLEGTIRYLKSNGKKGDIVMFMGAGDIYEWSKHLVSHRL